MPAPRSVSSSVSHLFIWAIAHLLQVQVRGGRFQIFLDNLSCVFILGGAVSHFAVDALLWGEFVTGGTLTQHSSPWQLLQLQLDSEFELQEVWLPRERNNCADYLSRCPRYDTMTVASYQQCTAS